LSDNYNITVNKATILKDSKEAVGALITSSISFGRIYNEIKNDLSDEEKILFNLIIKLRGEYRC